MVSDRKHPRTHIRGVARSFHADACGGIAILLLLTVFVLVALLGMIWNVGEYSVRRNRLQDAADAAAHSAAVWMSRGTNTVTGINMALIRNGSAQGIAEAHFIAQIQIGQRLAVLAKIPGPHLPEVARELALLLKLVAQTDPTCFKAIAELPRRYGELADYQQRLVNAFPDAIEQQRRQIERFHGCSIMLVQPKAPPLALAPNDTPFPPMPLDAIRLPVRRSTLPHQQFSLVLVRRMRRDAEAWDSTYRQFILGLGSRAWLTAQGAAIGLVMVYPPKRHYVLETSSLADLEEVSSIGGQFGEDPFTKAERLRHFTVFAVAQPSFMNQPRMVLTRYFQRPPPMIAFAQAETFNGLNASVVVRTRFNIAPWRLWTKAGWNWRARLTVADGIEEAIFHHRKIRRALTPDAWNSGPGDMYDAITNH